MEKKKIWSMEWNEKPVKMTSVENESEKYGIGFNVCQNSTFKYSQLSLRRTPSGPASDVRLREVSGLKRVDVTWPQEV